MKLTVTEGVTLSVEVTDIAFPNDYGVARYGGAVLFIPKGLPGDVVRVRVRRVEPRYVFADIIDVERPSDARIAPQCPHFADCGGCSIQHLTYEKQVEFKARYLRETLRRIGGIEPETVPVREPVPSPELFFYRSKIELASAMSGDSPIFGLKQRDIPANTHSGTVAPVPLCKIFHPCLRELLPLAETLARNLHLKPFDPRHGRNRRICLVLRQSKTTGQVMVIIEAVRGLEAGTLSFARDLAREAPWIDSIYSAVLLENPTYRIIEGLVHHHGVESIVEEVQGVRLKVYPASFFQPNPKAAALLYGVLAEKAKLRGTEKVLGLFCGIGSIELVLSKGALSVTGVDALEANITNARENGAMNERINCTFEADRVERFLRDRRRGRYDRIVVDPPRSGIPRAALDCLGVSGAPEILYVSCSPPTLARDLKILARHGYGIDEIIPFDFFPHTSHLEALAVLVKH